MQDIALAGYFKFKYTVTKIYHSCWIGMPTILVGLVWLQKYTILGGLVSLW